MYLVDAITEYRTFWCIWPGVYALKLRSPSCTSNIKLRVYILPWCASDTYFNINYSNLTNKNVNEQHGLGLLWNQNFYLVDFKPLTDGLRVIVLFTFFHFCCHPLCCASGNLTTEPICLILTWHFTLTKMPNPTHLIRGMPIKILKFGTCGSYLSKRKGYIYYTVIRGKTKLVK